MSHEISLFKGEFLIFHFQINNPQISPVPRNGCFAECQDTVTACRGTDPLGTKTALVLTPKGRSAVTRNEDFEGGPREWRNQKLLMTLFLDQMNAAFFLWGMEVCLPYSWYVRCGYTAYGSLFTPHRFRIANGQLLSNPRTTAISTTLVYHQQQLETHMSLSKNGVSPQL